MKKERFLRFSMESLFEIGIIRFRQNKPLNHQQRPALMRLNGAGEVLLCPGRELRDEQAHGATDESGGHVNTPSHLDSPSR